MRILLLCGVLLLATPASADGGCAKDIDCKGERICVQRQCVEPPTQAPARPEQSADVPLPPPVPAASAAPAGYQPSPPPPPPSAAGPIPAGPLMALPDTRHRHLGGFFRPDLGFGYFTTSASSNGSDASVSGLAGTFGIAAGGALSENSILAVHLWDTVVSDPHVTFGSLSGTGSGTVALIGIGPEYTAYSKQNFYFSISPSLTRMSSSSSSGTGETNLGFGLRAAVGKEWWAGDHWGLGLVGHLSMSLNEDSGSGGPTWTSWAFTVAFSATYN